MESLIFLMLFFGAACILLLGVLLVLWLSSPDIRADIRADIMRDWKGR